jgi:hypothetical protein
VDIHCVKNVFQKSHSHSIVESVMLYKMKIDIEKLKESQIFKSFFNSYFNELFKILNENLQFIIIELKGKLDCKEYF